MHFQAHTSAARILAHAHTHKPFIDTRVSLYCLALSSETNRQLIFFALISERVGSFPSKSVQVLLRYAFSLSGVFLYHLSYISFAGDFSHHAIWFLSFLLLLLLFFLMFCFIFVVMFCIIIRARMPN